MRHIAHLLTFCFFTFIILAFINADTIDALKNHAKIYWWVASSTLVVVGTSFAYKSIDEIIFLIVPPHLQKKAKLHKFLFTALTVCPLIFLGINELAASTNGNEAKKAIAKITHYFGFQIYFLGANWVVWKFLSKFLLSEIPEGEKLVIERSAGKLLRWHYLGWTSFFLLSLFYPVWAIITCVAMAFFNNSLSFAIGRYFGRIKLSKFSSSKTLEGFIGSIIISLALFQLLLYWMFVSEGFQHKSLSCKLPMWLMYVWIVLVSILVHIGDNTFSVCKRALGYKNFGRMFGMEIGGFWDRFDSVAPVLFFSSIVIWIFYAAKNGTIGIP